MCNHANNQWVWLGESWWSRYQNVPSCPRQHNICKCYGQESLKYQQSTSHSTCDLKKEKWAGLIFLGDWYLLLEEFFKPSDPFWQYMWGNASLLQQFAGSREVGMWFAFSCSPSMLLGAGGLFPISGQGVDRNRLSLGGESYSFLPWRFRGMMVYRKYHRQWKITPALSNIGISYIELLIQVYTVGSE